MPLGAAAIAEAYSRLRSALSRHAAGQLAGACRPAGRAGGGKNGSSSAAKWLKPREGVVQAYDRADRAGGVGARRRWAADRTGQIPANIESAA